MKIRRLLAAGMACLLVAGCSSGRTDSGASLGAEAGNAASADCAGAELKVTDTGITADTITIETVADVGSQVLPGLANGSLEAAKAWAAMVNKTGGLACRQVEVRTFDSKMDPNEARSGMVDACQNSLAMVGDTMIAVGDVTPIAECADAGGQQTGLPHITASVAGSVVACNPTTYLALGGQFSCPPAQGERSFMVGTATGEYVRDLVGGPGQGFYVMGYSTPGILEVTLPPVQEMRSKQGLPGALVGVKGSDPQATYTPIVKRIQQSGAKFVYNIATFPSFVLLQSEAKAQGVTVPHWVCQTCYDPAYVKAAGDLAKGVEVVLSTLPFEEAATNEEMKAFTENVKTHNTFALTAWASARLFQKAVEDVVAKDGPNGLTRKALLAALESVRDFDAGGISGPVTPSEQKPSGCLVVMRVTDAGTFERVFPKEPGKLHCGSIESITFDPVKAYSAG